MDKKNNTKSEKEKFIEKRQRADNKNEYIIKKSPAQTVGGKIIIAIIIFSFVLLPLVSLLVAIFSK